MKIGTSTFQGMLPRVAPNLLGLDQAQSAVDCAFLLGTLKPIRVSALVTTLPDALRQTVYPYNSAWLSWAADVNVVKAPVTDDAYQRIYYTGDGVPKVRGIDGATEYEYDLGLPVPAVAPTLTVQDKGATTWTRSWFWQYEETDATVKDSGTLNEGTDITVVTAGKSYTLNSIPAKVNASSDAVLIVYFDAYNASSELLGRVYPGTSLFVSNNDLEIDGAAVSMTQTTGSASATLELAYDTSSASDFTSDRLYVWTWLSGWGEEGRPSAASRTVTVDPTKDVRVSGLPTTAPAGDYNLTTKRLYRTVTSTTGTQYQFVADVPLATATYTDSLTDADCDHVLPSSEWSAPPATLAGLVVCPWGGLAGFVGNAVYFTPPYRPHAWPSGYVQTFEYDVVAMAVTGNSLVVLTKAFPYVIVGNEPTALTITRLPIQQGCVSKRSVVSYANMVAFASPDGYVSLDGGNAVLATRNLYTRDEWQALVPSGMIAAVHDTRLHVFAAGTALVFDVNEQRSILTTTTETAAGVYSDPDTDALYLIQGTSLVSWQGGATNKTATWRSRVYLTERPWYPCVARVLADSYPQTLRAYGDGTLAATCTVASGTAFRLPRLARQKKWEWEVVTTAEIRDVILAQGMDEIR